MNDFTKRTILGRTGLSVSRLGLASGYGISAEGVEKAYHEYGINYFYWSNPRRKQFGDGLQRLAKGHRQDLVIVLQSYDHVGFAVKWSVKKGLKTLGINHADVLLLGWFNSMPPNRLLAECMELKQAGLIRNVAISGHNRKFFGELAQRQDSPIDIFMIRYNAAHRGAEREVFPFLQAENKPGVSIYTATCWGKLVNQKNMPHGEAPVSAADCYRFVLSNPAVDLCMIGPRTEQQMKEGLSGLTKGPLSEIEMDRIRKIGDHVHG